MLVFVKLGGSVITDKTKPYTPRIKIIKRLAKEIHEARKENESLKLIVGHGGGSFPHVSAAKYQTHKGIINEESYRGIAIVQNDAAKLNRIIVNSLIEIGENAISVQPSSAVIAKNGKIISWDIRPIKIFLKYDLIPVPYGDVGIDIKNGCCILSTEEIFDYLSRKLKPDLIVLVGNVNGVYDSNGKLIQKISRSNFKEIKKHLAGSKGIADVTGGMLTKVEKMIKLADRGIKTLIINGNKDGLLRSALVGEKTVGTLITK